MPESMTPLIILGVVGVLFVLLLSLLTNNYSLNNIKSKNRWRRPVRNRALGNGSGDPKSLRHGSL